MPRNCTKISVAATDSTAAETTTCTGWRRRSAYPVTTASTNTAASSPLPSTSQPNSAMPSTSMPSGTTGHPPGTGGPARSRPLAMLANPSSISPADRISGK